MVLGRAASTVMAERNSGIYRDVIVGHTRDYIIQRIGKQPAAVCREIRSSIISRSQVEHALIGASVSDGLRIGGQFSWSGVLRPSGLSPSRMIRHKPSRCSLSVAV